MALSNQITNVCKIGQGENCCKYLVMGKNWECMKAKPENKKVIDNNWATTPHVSQGDNCEGIKDLHLAE